ncbi:MAG TPA: Veg family protein [Clostridia bacterium]|nr:Veg family protein [Clostridia bacterium]
MKLKRERKETPSYNAEDTFNEVKALQGKAVKIEVIISNGKTKTEEGVITEVYPKLFLLENTCKGIKYKYTHTFVDIYTKRIIINPCEE